MKDGESLKIKVCPDHKTSKVNVSFVPIPTFDQFVPSASMGLPVFTCAICGKVLE